MTGGAQARLRPSLIPHFPRDIKDEKRNEGKKEEHVKSVKWKPKTFAFPMHFAHVIVSLTFVEDTFARQFNSKQVSFGIVLA